MENDQDELLKAAQAAMKKLRPARRKLGVVDRSGEVTTVIDEAPAIPPEPPANVVPLRPKRPPRPA